MRKWQINTLACEWEALRQGYKAKAQRARLKHNQEFYRGYAAGLNEAIHTLIVADKSLDLRPDQHDEL